MFKYPKATGTTLEEVAAQIHPGLQVGPIRKPTSAEAEHGIESAQDVMALNGSRGTVHCYPNGRIGADLSDFASGYSRGNAVGQMLGDLAFNTGRKFFGDPGRYSPDGQARFPEMLLSSALKHGTTRHLEIDPRDADRFGIEWGDNDAQNARQLIDRVRKNVREAVLEVDGLRYNFQHERFDIRERSGTWRAGSRAALEGFATAVAERTGSSLSGRATLQRAAYLDSLLRASGQGTGNDVLAELSRLGSPGGRVAPALKRLFYSRADGARSGAGLPIPEVTRIADAVRAAWANPPEVIVAADMNDPRIPQAVRDYDAEQRSQGAGEPEGFFLDGKVYLIAGQLATPADVVRVLAHEALGHYGLRGLFGGELSKILD